MGEGIGYDMTRVLAVCLGHPERRDWGPAPYREQEAHEVADPSRDVHGIGGREVWGLPLAAPSRASDDGLRERKTRALTQALVH